MVDPEIQQGLKKCEELGLPDFLVASSLAASNQNKTPFSIELDYEIGVHQQVIQSYKKPDQLLGE